MAQNVQLSDVSLIVVPKKDEQLVPGMSDAVGNIGAPGDYGDSGDSFDHLSWRGLFGMLSATKAGKNFFISMSASYLLRGKSLKRENKGKCVRYTLRAIEFTEEERNRNKDFWVGKTEVEICVNFPTEVSKVPAMALTPERLKCLLRPYIAPELMKRRLFPAVSTTNGYKELVISMCMILDEFVTYKDFLNNKEDENKLQRLSKIEVDAWYNALSLAENHGVLSYFMPSGAFAGCISSKEIYDFDEKLIPGTVFWSGIHALMTDVCNKYRADKVTADVRARYEQSNFYDDFKRKMAARKMTIVNTKKYINFLSDIAAVIPFYVLTSSSLKTVEEVNIIDGIMSSITSLQSQSIKLGRSNEEEKPLTFQTGELLEKHVLERTAVSGFSPDDVEPPFSPRGSPSKPK